jgi:hypothetical protein
MKRILVVLCLGGIFLGRSAVTPAHAMFSWDSCGGTTVHVNSLSISPDPIVLNQRAMVSENITVASAVKRATITPLIEKQIFGVWTEIPVSYSLQVHLKQGTYALNDVPVYIPDPGVSWFGLGDYYTKLVTTDDQGSVLNCTEVYFSIAG